MGLILLRFVYRPVGREFMTKEDILEAAAQVFRVKGYHAASMNDIAEVVNVQKASLYHHISSKQEILLALLDRGIDLLLKRISDIVAVDLPAEEKITPAIQAYLETLTEHGDLAVVLLFDYRSLEDSLRERHIQRRDELEGLWRSLISQGVESGAFSCPDPALAARYLLGVLNWTVTWYRPAGKLTASEIGAGYAHLFLQGLMD
jgi:AcrR family transcriptional regulator